MIELCKGESFLVIGTVLLFNHENIKIIHMIIVHLKSKRVLLLVNIKLK